MKKMLLFMTLLCGLTAKAQTLTTDAILPKEVSSVAEMKKVPSGELVQWNLDARRDNEVVVIASDGQDAFVADAYSGLRVKNAGDRFKAHAVLGGTDIGYYSLEDGVPTYESLEDAGSSWYVKADNEPVGRNVMEIKDWQLLYLSTMVPADAVCNKVMLRQPQLKYMQMEGGEPSWYVVGLGASFSMGKARTGASPYTYTQDNCIRIVDHFNVCATSIMEDAPLQSLLGVFMPDGNGYALYPLEDIGQLQQTFAANNPVDVSVYHAYSIYAETPQGGHHLLQLQPSNEMAMETRTIDGKTYSVYRLGAPLSIVSEDSRELLYRQEGKKVYRYDTATQQERLVFDYSLQQGDTFTNGQGVRMQVMEVWESGVNLDEWTWNTSSKGRTLLLQGVDDATQKDVWVEGIGSLYTGLLSADYLPGLLGWQVEWCVDGLNTAAHAINTAAYKSVPLDCRTWNAADLDREPPVQEQLSYEFIGDTLHVFGSMRLNSYVYMFSCKIDGTSIQFEEEPLLPLGRDLADGFVLRWVDIHIPGFAPGTYTIRSFGNDEEIQAICQPASSIHTVTTASSPTQLFDLQGRPVTTPPARGIYIKDGKKYYVK